ncbi:MAG: hypothetical protein HKN75_10110 [Bacteroidia bacterium]|nr:hypothetical protein [Bacteroidia bacterium]
MNFSTLLKTVAFLAVTLFFFSPFQSNAQLIKNAAVHGNFQLDAQYYIEDSSINAPDVPEKMLMNGFANIIFTSDNFEAGVRYESYENALLGFDPRYEGSGIPFRYATYTSDELTVTVGNFYEQFGNGLIFRSYEERTLGVDNAVDGVRIKYIPIRGLNLKTFIGKQRSFFDKGPGIVRGADATLNITDVFNKSESPKSNLSVGIGVVSKYQDDQDPIYNLPENVLAFSPRLNYSIGNISLSAEYAHKYNDPSTINELIYKNGDALLLSATYTKKGIGFVVSAKRMDNMDFRSDRTAQGNNLNINYLPALTKIKTYRLSTLYPYATQPNGEMGLQSEFFYKIKRGTPLGGKYGTKVSFNFTSIHNIDTTWNVPNDTMGYESDFFALGDEKYYQDFSVEVEKKFSMKSKLITEVLYFVYDKDVIQGLSGFGKIHSNIVTLDFEYKFNNKHSLRTELQHLYTEQDMQSWAFVLAEWSISPNWFISAFDEYNYGNDIEDDRIHYLNTAVAYVKKANRISLGYGKQREGLLCVGGICRNVPASNGFTLSVSSSF